MAKVQYGLRNVYISKITESGGVVTYGTPFKLPGAVSLSLSPTGDESVFYADDIRYYVVSASANYEGNMVIAMITDDFAKDILGYEEDATTHVLVETADGKLSSFAMMFEVQNDEDETLFCFYNVTPSRVDVSASTREESTEVQTATLNITCSGAIDTGFVKAYTTDDTPSATKTGWFSAVPVPSV